MADPFTEFLKRALEGSGPGQKVPPTEPAPSPTRLREPAIGTSVPGSTPIFASQFPYRDPSVTAAAPAVGDIAAPEVLQRIADALGMDPKDLAAYAAGDPEGWASLVQKFTGSFGAATSGGGGSGSGGASRFLFPEEQRQLELQNEALARELELSKMGASRFENMNGVLFDPLTGEIYDPTTAGLGRDELGLAKERFGFESGRQFDELIRQFNEENSTSRRGQDITQRGQDLNYDLGIRGEDRLNRALQLDAQLGLNEQGLEKARFISDVVKSPSDALTRLAMQRGGTSPTDHISQADVINSVNEMFQNTSRIGTPVPRYEEGTEGGPVRSRLSIIGEKGPELLVNHGDGSFDVVNNDDSKLLEALMDWITRPDSKRTTIKDNRPKAGKGGGGGGGGSWGKLSKLAQALPNFAGGTIDFFGTGSPRIQPPPSPYKPGGGVDQGLIDEYNAYNSGDIYGAQAPTSRLTQGDLVGYAREATSPAGQSLISGSTPSEFRIPGLPTPTAMNFARLSGAERENLNTRLAVEFNSTLEDLMFAIQQRYGTNNERRARYLT